MQRRSELQAQVRLPSVRADSEEAVLRLHNFAAAKSGIEHVRRQGASEITVGTRATSDCMGGMAEYQAGMHHHMPKSVQC